MSILTNFFSYSYVRYFLWVNIEMKILFLHAHNNIQGQELSLVDRIKALRNLGVECGVAVPGPGVFSELLEKEKIRTHFVYYPELNLRELLLFVLNAIKVIFIIIFGRYDIVHSNGAYPNVLGVFAAKMTKKAAFCTLSVYYPSEILKKKLVNRCNVVIAISEFIFNSAKECGFVAKNKLYLLYNGIFNPRINLTLQEKKDLKNNLEIPDDCLVIAQFAALRDFKRFEDFVDMANLLIEKGVDAIFLIVGNAFDKQYEEFLRQKVRELGIGDRVKFLGFRKDIHCLLEITDISVLPSEKEALGRVLVEALQHSVPTVVTDNGGKTEVIKHMKTGLVVTHKSPESLVSAVEKILEDGPAFKEIANSGKQFVKDNFDIDNQAIKLKKLYSISCL